MDFTEALKKINRSRLRITRKNWPYELYFSRIIGYLMIKSNNGLGAEISSYAIHETDFEYNWEIKE